MRAPVINIGELRTKAANINGKLRQEPVTAELVKHCQDLLRFAQREDWDEHTRPALESALERLSEPSLFTGPRPAAGLRVITSRAFHD